MQHPRRWSDRRINRRKIKDPFWRKLHLSIGYSKVGKRATQPIVSAAAQSELKVWVDSATKTGSNYKASKLRPRAWRP